MEELECGPSALARMEAAAADAPLPLQMISLPPYVYVIFTPLSVRASENLATADKHFPGALYSVDCLNRFPELKLNFLGHDVTK